jgi:hypothetical protein
MPPVYSPKTMLDRRLTQPEAVKLLKRLDGKR